MSRLYRLHQDDTGLSSLQTVMILAIAAIILAAIKYVWWDIKNWFTIWVFNIVDFEGS